MKSLRSNFFSMKGSLSRDEMKKIIAGDGGTGCPATCTGTTSCSSTSTSYSCECENNRVCTQHNYNT